MRTFRGITSWIPSLLRMSLFHARPLFAVPYLPICFLFALRDLARPQLMSEPISPSVYFLLDRANFFMDDPYPLSRWLTDVLDGIRLQCYTISIYPRKAIYSLSLTAVP